jgi:hypothetical protein
MKLEKSWPVVAAGFAADPDPVASPGAVTHELVARLVPATPLVGEVPRVVLAATGTPSETVSVEIYVPAELSASERWQPGEATPWLLVSTHTLTTGELTRIDAAGEVPRLAGPIYVRKTAVSGGFVSGAVWLGHEGAVVQ